MEGLFTGDRHRLYDNFYIINLGLSKVVFRVEVSIGPGSVEDC